MQDFFTFFLFALTQGILEFLPVSSSAHTTLVALFLNPQNIESIKFFTELATFFCVLLYFKSLIVGHLVNPFRSIHFFGKIFISTLPFVSLFFFLHNIASNISLFLILGSILFIVAEFIYKNKHTKTTDLNSITYKQAFIIGCFQVPAMFSGFSRSGSTIAGGMICGLDKSLSVRFSFLISLPLTFASLIYDFIKIKPVININTFGVLVITFLISVVAIKPCFNLVSKISLNWFAGYRIILAFILICIPVIFNY